MNISVNATVVNSIVPIDQVKVGDYLVVDNIVSRVTEIYWSRPLCQYLVDLDGEDETRHYNDGINVHMVNVAVVLS